MTNALPTQPDTTPDVAPPLPEIVEQALVGGDLSKLNISGRLSYYHARCKAAGLNPVTRPFEFLQLNGRLVLYATKSCTDGLARLHGLSHTIVSRQTVEDVHEVIVRVSSPAGRSTEDLGAVVVGRLQGEALANARLKAVTKAKQRATLSFCGLGDVIDETELDTVRDARRCDDEGNPIEAHHAKHHDNQSGHGSGAYADPETCKGYTDWLATTVEDINAKWLDHHTGAGGEITKGVKDLLSTWQLSGHLLKWARSQGLVNAPEEIRAGQRDKFTALVWQRSRGHVQTEALRYGREKWREAMASLKPDEPTGEDESDVWPEGRE